MTASRLPVTRFTGEYAFLSDFSPSPIVHEGATYPTAEHLFQALKTDDPAKREGIRLADTPTKAKRLGRRVPLRSDWQTARNAVMRYVVEQEFRQNPDLGRMLLGTGDCQLREGNSWGDTYWGVFLKTGQGQNMLGRILEEVRASLRAAL